MKSAANLFAPAAALAAAIALAGGVASTEALARPPEATPLPDMGPAGDYPMVLGNPFVVDGVTYTPADMLNYDAVGYAGESGGAGISGAHRTLPLPSYVEVTSLETGHTILVRIDQRGPMAGSRLIDLSPKAWAQLGLSPGSHPAVRVRRVNPPEQERALLRLGNAAPERMETPPGLLTALKRKLGVPVPAPSPTSAAVPPAPAPVPAKVARQNKVASKPDPIQPGRKLPPAAAAAPAAKVAEAKPASPAAPVPVPSRPSAAAAASGFFVQAAAFSTRARADSVAKALGGTVSPAGRLFRVRTGPYAGRDQADAALAKVRAAGYADARVLHAP